MLNKTCFIVTPIGKEGSDTRWRLEQWMEYIYRPAVGQEFHVISADEIGAPGRITEQILDQLVNAELAIIDYTELNPNVMYEAAIRHLSKKPYIQIYPNTVSLPFDIKDLRTISYDPTDICYPAKLVVDITNMYKETQKPGFSWPEFIPLKIDFDKVVSDPKKFVDLLKKHIILAPTNGGLVTAQDNIIEVYDDQNMLRTGHSTNLIGTGLTTNPIYKKCPKCGALKTFPQDNYLMAHVLSGSKHYHCNVCGTDFA